MGGLVGLQHATKGAQTHIMKATFDPTANTKWTTSHRRETGGLHREYSLLVPSPYYEGEANAVVTLRLYWPSTVCYACLWVHSEKVTTQGSGSAGGGGYCKASASAGEAIANAGFTLDKDICGASESAIREALRAIAVEIGHPEALLHEAHA